MRAELPWNISGIPPEAREAARAAARREGLSVGEWLTRRILRSFSGMEEDFQPPPERLSLDPWGLPLSAGSRRDSEEMFARREGESFDSYRKIEDQLRSVARRLDSAERSQTENNRVMSKTASEISIATREQAQAFDQLTGHVMDLGERIDRLESSQAHDALKDAVKVLHQGLARLAEQITQTANQSAGQIATLAGSLEQLSAHLSQLRSDSEALGKVLEQRLGAVEKASQFNTNALDHALEKLEAQATIRASDQAEAHKQQSQTELHLARLEENLSRLEVPGHDPAIDQRLDGIDRFLSDVAQRLDHDAIQPIEEQVQQLGQRLESLDRQHHELLDELRAKLAPPVAPPPPLEPEPVLAEPPASPVPTQPLEAPEAESFETTPFEEAPAEAPPAFDSGFDASSFPAAFNQADPFAAGFAPDNFAPDGLASAPAGFEEPDLSTPEEEPPALPENFLSAARRSAQAAAESEIGGGRIRGPAAKSRGRFVIPLVLGLIGAVVVGALAINQRLTPKPPAPPPARAAKKMVAPARPAPSKPALPRPPGSAFVPMPAEPQPSLSPAPPLPDAPPPRSALQDTGERLTQLANSGDAQAQTILGLKYLDGEGVPADLGQADRWLSKAAELGQPVAQYRLGTMYERGQGVAADSTKAMKWYLAAANQGNRKAMHNLAVAYAGGSGDKKDMEEAARWFAKAAALGLSDSQFNLAVLYERGDGVPQSLIDAYKWYAIAAAAGDVESKQRLSVLQTQLSDADRAAAQKAASAFRAAPLSRAANVPPDISDLPAP